jgi:hypothetical protein
MPSKQPDSIALRTLRVMHETLALEKKKDLREHYAGTKRQWRFVVGVRVALMLAFLSAIGALLNVYWNLLLHKSVPSIYHLASFASAIFGILFTQAIYTINRELYRLQRKIEQQGLHEEDNLHDHSNMFHDISGITGENDRIQVILKVTFYGLFFTWAFLAILSILAITKVI